MVQATYICARNIVKVHKTQGIFVVPVDPENALDETWLHALDVDTSEENYLNLIYP